MKKFLRKRGSWILTTALLLTLAAGAITRFAPELIAPVTGEMGAIAAPFRAAAAAVADRVESAYDYAFRYEELCGQVSQLEGEVERLSAENRAARAALEENRRLRTLLGLQQAHADFVFASAAVTGRTMSSWTCVLTIGAGSDAGIAPDMCVVTQQGDLVGIVTEVGPNWAAVTALIAPGTNIGVRVEPSGDIAVLSGDLDHMSAGVCALHYLGTDAGLAVGDTVVTSGVGGNYPAGLTVGTVTETGMLPSGMERYGVVAPSVELDELKQVFVIKAFDVVE